MGSIPRASATDPDLGTVSLLTGGDDKSYAIGLTRALTRAGVLVDFIGSDTLDDRELRENARVRFLNLRGDQRSDVSIVRKATRLTLYYSRLLAYSAQRRPRGLLHILWNNRIEWVDRTLLMYWYRMLGHRVVLTAHNVNAARRDGHDSCINRATLRQQYRLCDHIFVHTGKMKRELIEEFHVVPDNVSVIPFGLNETAPRSGISRADARARLGLVCDARVVLFFGQIAPYKGLEYLVRSLPYVSNEIARFTLIIAGKIKAGHEEYWNRIRAELARTPQATPVIQHIQHIPDKDIETYFEAADVLALPYVSIFQSGVPFLAYSFGLPVVATDVGSLAEDVIDGQTGFICRPCDPVDLARAVTTFFRSSLHRDAEVNRRQIARTARDRYSWDEVARITSVVYRQLTPPLRRDS